MHKVADTFTGKDAPASSIAGAKPMGGVGVKPMGTSTPLPKPNPAPQQPAITPPKPITTPAAKPNASISSFLPDSWNKKINQVSELANQGMPTDASHLPAAISGLSAPNKTMMHPDKWNHAKTVTDWLDKNPNHAQVLYKQNPNLESQVQQYKSPLGQVAQTAVPMLHGAVKDPESFARLASMPGIGDVFKNTVGQFGVPGLALAHGFLSGNMGNWNDLTAGLHDPNQRVPGRDMYKEVGNTFNKTSGYDMIDQHLNRLKQIISR